MDEVLTIDVGVDVDEDVAGGVIDGIRHGTSQMSIISVINSTRFPFEVKDHAAYKGGIITTFN